MIRKLRQLLWGQLSREELFHFLGLGAGFFILVGSYWPLKMLKSSIFLGTVGYQYIPMARTLSLLMFFPTMLVYSVLVDTVPRKQLFTYACLFYASLGSLITLVLAHPVHGLANSIPNPGRIIGWAFYLFVDNYISMLISLYWALINDTTSQDSAKRGYGLLMFFTQAGALTFLLAGRSAAQETALYQSLAPAIAAISLTLLAALGLTIPYLIPTKKPDEEAVLTAPEAQTFTPESFFEMFTSGLTVIATRPYVAGIFGIIAFQNIASEVFSYQMHALVAQSFTDPGLRNYYLFNYGVVVQVIACSFALFGTSAMQRIVGIRLSLLSYPLLLGTVVCLYLTAPSLYAMTMVMVCTKALGYALNQPTKEMLYIPTDTTTKYKAKGWIDIFGERFAKVLGAHASGVLGVSTLKIGAFLGLFFSAWVGVAHYMGRSFQKLSPHKSPTDRQ